MKGDGWLCSEMGGYVRKIGGYIERWVTMKEIGGYAGRSVAI